jgi:hypothetical protein
MSKLINKSMVILIGWLASSIWSIHALATNNCSCNNLDSCQSAIVKQLCQKERQKLEDKRQQFKNPFQNINNEYEDKFSASKISQFNSKTFQTRVRNNTSYNNHQNDTDSIESNQRVESQHHSTSNQSQNTNPNKKLVPLF